MRARTRQILRMLHARQGRPRVRYSANSNRTRVQQEARVELLRLAGSEGDMMELLHDLLKTTHPAYANSLEEMREFTDKVRNNIRNLFCSLPSHSCVRPAIRAKLIQGISYKEAKDLTGCSDGTVAYARHKNFDPDDVLSQLPANVIYYS